MIKFNMMYPDGECSGDITYVQCFVRAGAVVARWIDLWSFLQNEQVLPLNGKDPLEVARSLVPSFVSASDVKFSFEE